MQLRLTLGQLLIGDSLGKRHKLREQGLELADNGLVLRVHHCKALQNNGPAAHRAGGISDSLHQGTV